MLKGHGDNGYTYGQEILADFSSNVWYGSEPEGLKEHLFSHWHQVNRYPQVLAESLAEKISGHYGLAPDNILVCNGATESMYLIAQAFRKKRSRIVIPSFSEYEDACRTHEHTLQFISWEEWKDLEGGTRERHKNELADGPNLWWTANPNNPTGAIFTGLRQILQIYPRTLFVVDEAFIEFTRSAASAIPLVSSFPNLIILRSLTKAFSIPGLRLGYIIADAAIINILRKSKMPWSVNSLALEAGNFIFDRYDSIQPPVDRLLEDKADLISALHQAGIQTYDSHTHFFLCKIAGVNVRELQRWLLDNHNLLIRDAGNFRGLGQEHFRLATLSPDKNQLLIKAMKLWQQQRA